MKRRYTLAELAAHTGAQLIGDPALEIAGVNTLEEAGASDASFLANPRYREQIKTSKAGVICVDESVPAMPGQNFLISPHPSRTFQTIAELILLTGNRHSGFPAIHPTAVIHESAQIGPNAIIGPYAVIDRDVKIGAHAIIGAHVFIGHEVAIGDHCQLHPGCVVRERCQLGHRVILQPGAVVGSCGFGYHPDPQTGRPAKLEQLGIVVIGDDVEIGAHSAIDRSRFKETRIGSGTKIDNLVQVAHNVELGENNLIAAQTGIAGSAKTGKGVMMGGQVGIVGHVELEDEVMIATRGGVSKSLKKGKYRGSPAIPIHEFHRQEAHVRKLEEYVERIRHLEKKVETLEAFRLASGTP